MDVLVEEGLEPLEALQPDWDALVARSAAPHPFMLHAWLLQSLRHLGDASRPFTACFRDDGRLIGAASLQLSRSILRRQWTFACRHVDYNDFVIESGREWDVLEAFFGWARDERTDWDLMRLRGVWSRSPTDALLPVLAEAAGLAVCGWRLDPCPYLRLPATREEFHATMPGRRWQKEHGARRARKLAREHGEPSFEVLEGPAVTADGMGRFLDLHVRSWEQRGGSMAVDNERLRRFHLALAEALAPSGLVRLFWLRVGDREVAGSYGFLLGDTFYGYMSAQDPEFAAYSVGRQIMLAVIEHGIDQGWREIDMLVGAERYKLDYTHRCRHTMEYAVARSRGRLALTRALSALRGRPCR